MHRGIIYIGLWATLLVVAGSCRQKPSDPKSRSQIMTALQLYPDSTLLYQQLIDSLMAAGLPDTAAQWCDSAAQKDTKNEPAWRLLGADLLRSSGQPGQAAEKYKQYLQRFEADVQILLNLANSLAENADEEALLWCDSINAQFPQPDILASSHFIRGVLFFEQKKYDEAVKWYNKALSLRINFPEAWMEKGYCLYDAGKYKEAAEAFEKLTTLQAGNAAAWYWQAKCTEATGSIPQAIALYERAYSLNGQLGEAKQAIDRLKK